MTHTTRIPSGSAFLNAGGGSGGADAASCWSFEWYVEQANPEFAAALAAGWVVDPRSGWAYNPVDPFMTWLSPSVYVDHKQASTAWRYREITPSGSWKPELQGQLDYGSGNWSVDDVTMESIYSLGGQYYALNAPLATAKRRFEVYCGQPAASRGHLLDLGGNALEDLGLAVGFLEVGMRDPFWDPMSRLGVLWNSVQLPPVRVARPPEAQTWGGLVVNMPTWLQITTDAWRPYFSPVDHYMGWDSQLGLFPAQLDFEVVGPHGRLVPCAPEVSNADVAGLIPAAPKDLPELWTDGQWGSECSWTPQERGEVTIRARITYDVLLTISGYSEWLAPYVWWSEPLTLTVGELHSVNVTPDGGIGG